MRVLGQMQAGAFGKPRRVLALGFVLALSVLASGVAPVAAAAQSAATNDYNHWVIADWQWRLSLPAKAARPGACITRSQHAPVWFLDPNNQASSLDVTCTIPAGRSIMLAAPSAECTTVGKPPYPASTDAFLRRCAKRLWDRHPGTLDVTVDGGALHPAGFLIATDAFSFTQPAQNNLTHVLGHTNGRAAVYGSASILSPLSRGTHTLVENLAYSRSPVSQHVTYHITVG